MKKVLLVNDHIRFFGGGDAALFLEKKILEGAGYKVFTYSLSKSIKQEDSFFYENEPSNLTKQKIEKFFLGKKGRLSFEEVLDKIKPDIIHFHLISKYPISIYSSKKLKNYKTIQTLHGPNLFCATSWGCIKKNSAPCEWDIGVKCYTRGCIPAAHLPFQLSLKAQIKHGLKNNIDVFHCPSLHLLSSVRRLGFSNSVYFPLSVDEKFLTEPPKQNFNHKPIILYVGALVDVKGIDYLIKAFILTIKKNPTAKLHIAGQGVQRAYLEQLVKDNNLVNNVKFLGFVGREDIVTIYKTASVLVVPSIWQEQFGLVGPEALALGIPCIGSNIGGIPEWLHHEEWGYLVPPRAPEDLDTAIGKIISNRNLAKEMGALGRKFVIKHYSVERYRQNILNLVENV